MRIQHNIAAMNAYRNYTNNTSAVSKNLEKLSSGYKINRAGDDAAGLAISEKMRAQISGLKAAQKNAKDGISLVKTAEGALQEVHDMLNRMVTLATQSANGTYDNSTDRAQLQKEVDQLKAEIDRIADSSNFNGIKLLDGSQSSDPTSFSNVSLTAVRDGTSLKAAANGKYELDLSKATWTASTDGATAKITFAGKSATVTITKAGGTATGAQVATELKKQMLGTGTTVTIGGKEFTVNDDGKGKLTFTGTNTKTIAAGTDTSVTNESAGMAAPNDGTGYKGPAPAGMGGNQGWSMAWTQIEEPVSSAASTLAQSNFNLTSLSLSDGTVVKIGDISYTFAVGKNSQYKSGSNVVDLTDYEVGASGITQAAARRLTGVANGNAGAFVEYNGTTIMLTEKEGGINREDYDLIGATETAISDATWKNQNGQSFVQFGQSTGGGMTLQIGDTADTYNQLKVSVKDCHTKAMGISGLNIADQASAATAISSIRSAINYVSDVRGTLGATQNRLEHTINNLSVMTENIQDAESTIRDTDIAEEMMAYTKNNILVQSAQAMLAQANQIPQGVLQLLG